MREIKFRAWDGRTMFNVDVLAISPCGWDCSDYGKRGVSLAYQPHIKVMQYTGLEDRNGKEIYEGDIVTDGISDGSIFWHVSRAMYMVDSSQCDIAPMDDWCELIVIGNIFENPELLDRRAENEN